MTASPTDSDIIEPVAIPAGPSNWALIRRMLGLGWRYRWGCIRLLVLQCLLLLTALACLGLTGLGIDLIRHFHSPDTVTKPAFPFGLTPPTGWSPMSQVAVIAGLILAFELTRSVLNYTYALSNGYLIHTKIVVDLRAQVYDKLQRLSFNFFDANATGSIINRVTGDVQSVRAFVDGVLIQLVILVISLIGFMSYMLTIHPMLTFACLATTPIMWLVTAIFSRMVRPLYDRNRELVDNVILRLAESIQGVQVIKGFGREQEEIDQFAKDNREVKDQQQGIFWRVSIFGPIIGYMTQLNLVILLAYGGYLVHKGELPLGSGLIVFAGLLQQFSSQVANLTNIANSVQQSLSGARRVFEILDAPIHVQNPANPEPIGRARGDVSLERVWFEYVPGAPVLSDITVKIAAGTRVAILGATGAGKSTLLSLLCRFYDPTRGRITLDGHDLRNLDLDELRQNIGLVFQETFLFSNTVAANIAFGHPEASQEQVEAAAKIAAAHEFIVNLPDGYQTILGESGLDLSGGQRQRLAIARAVLLNPALLLLDDPAAAIDPHTEHEILGAIEQAMSGRTTFIVAHRLSTLRACDLVMVMEEGRIVQFGTHDELLQQTGHYRLAAESQFAEV
ncbi:ABC transporter ATP-binding protein [Anatilimnocola sp. NA78]|uniref:ABC transporter ATP-binding protein n=1 Tax=Anatilimnocola sp. NA78 TaxID=3415683 RepID=UPI003CE56C26